MREQPGNLLNTLELPPGERCLGAAFLEELQDLGHTHAVSIEIPAGEQRHRTPHTSRTVDVHHTPAIDTLFDPGETLQNLRHRWRVCVDNRQPEILHLCGAEAVGLIRAFGAQIDNSTHTLTSQPRHIVKHQGSTYEHVLINNVPPVECEHQPPVGASQQQKRPLRPPQMLETQVQKPGVQRWLVQAPLAAPCVVRYTHTPLTHVFHLHVEENIAMHTTPRQVHVRVPATTANLGSGFDVLGLALQLYNVFTLTITSQSGWRVRVPPGIKVPGDEKNLVLRAARALFTRVGQVPAGLHLHPSIQIPLSRGLGSSSSAIVGGLVAANVLTGKTLDTDTLLAMAVEIEGHPDNVTPALMGGLTLSYTQASQHRFLALPFPSALTLVVAIPHFELSTSQARSVLPPQVSRSDAIFNCSRTALLVHALHSGRHDLLAAAMEDRLHQPYRAALVPGMQQAITAGYAAGACGVALSGAGPSLLAIAAAAPERVALALQQTFAQYGVTCTTRQFQADMTGAVAWEQGEEAPG